jgi:hypothetical protein
MRFFSQAICVCGLIAATSAVAPAESDEIGRLFLEETQSWQLLRSERGHDETGFEKDLETALARVTPDSPAPSGRCGLPP